MARLIRIGIHGSNPSLLALSGTTILQRHLAPLDANVEWVRLPSGPQAVDYVGANLLDISGTGATPPIAGQANGVELVYLATSRPRPIGGIAVRADSVLRTPGDLGNARVAFAAGSWLQHLLAIGLWRGDLAWRDIVPLNLPDAAAKAALRAGEIDAWATGDSLVGQVDFRFIAQTGDLISNRSVFFAARGFAERNPDLVDVVVQSLDEVDRWIESNPDEAGAALEAAAGKIAAGGDLGHWRVAVRGRPWGLVPISDAFLDEQQEAADLFLRFGLLTRPINLREAVLARPIAIARAA
jgi:sulfonate transport system substrate-binding protein